MYKITKLLLLLNLSMYLIIITITGKKEKNGAVYKKNKKNKIIRNAKN